MKIASIVLLYAIKPICILSILTIFSTLLSIILSRTFLACSPTLCLCMSSLSCMSAHLFSLCRHLPTSSYSSPLVSSFTTALHCIAQSSISSCPHQLPSTYPPPHQMDLLPCLAYWSQPEPPLPEIEYWALALPPSAPLYPLSIPVDLLIWYLIIMLFPDLPDLMAQRLARRAEDRESPVPVPPKTNFSIMFTLPVKSTGE